MMSGVMSIAIGVFGIIWTVVASQIGGGIFALFGVVFVIVAIVSAAYNFKNATSKNRYSAFDITDESEESDPLNEHFGNSRSAAPNVSGSVAQFCPYCGAQAEGDFEFCCKCGKKLPD